MKYNLILKELKESPDRNIQRFANEVESMKRLSKKDRERLFKTPKEPGVVNMLVYDTIPYAMKVAYEQNKKSKTLSVLELINVGIEGAFAAFKRFDYEGINMSKVMRAYIKKYIVETIAENEIMSFQKCDVERLGAKERDVIEKMDHEVYHRRICHIIKDYFGDRYGQIIIDYNMERATADELAEKYGVGKERIRQIANMKIKDTYIIKKYLTL